MLYWRKSVCLGLDALNKNDRRVVAQGSDIKVMKHEVFIIVSNNTKFPLYEVAQMNQTSLLPI